MMTTRLLLAGLSFAVATAAAGQLLPGVPGIGPIVAGALKPLGQAASDARDLPGSAVQRLASIRIDRLRAAVRAHPREIERDRDGNPARAGEVVLTEPTDALIATAEAGGFRLLAREDALGVRYARFRLPAGQSLARGIDALRKLGAIDASADQLHFESGLMRTTEGRGAPAATGGAGPTIGMIDGGVAGGGVVQRGFATGAPHPSAHGTAIASLIAGIGTVRGAAPGARLLAADVYGTDPAGGSATAIVRALAWLVGERVPVVTISLVGPANPLLARVISAAQARGTIIVAAVGNDGPAAPPGFPASYPGVIAVTAVDGRKRVLIEAGRAGHLDYAAPGADMVAATPGGGTMPVRGTSFAAPLVAATMALAYREPEAARRTAAIARVDAGAEHRDGRYGRGIVCGACATPVR